jgi:hypothetical protein
MQTVFHAESQRHVESTIFPTSFEKADFWKVAVADKELKGSSQFGTNERKMRLRKSDEP